MVFRKWAALFAMCFFVHVCFHAQVSMAQYAGSFSRIGFGARGISLGNGLAGDTRSGTSPYYNPAFAPLVAGQNIEASVASLSFDRSLQFLQLSAPLQTKAGFALGLIHASVSDIDGRDNSGFHTKNLSVDEYAGFLAFGLKFSNRISAGVGLQMFRTDLFDGLTPANSIGLDFGFAAQVADNWSLGLVADDLLARYSWDSSDLGGSGRTITDSFPRRIRLGVSTYQLKGTLSFHGEVESRFSSVRTETRTTRIFGDSPAETSEEKTLVDQEFRLRAGTEYIPLQGFAVRVGLEQLGSEALDSVRPSFGFKGEQKMGELTIRAEYGLALEAESGGKMHLFSITLFL